MRKVLLIVMLLTCLSSCTNENVQELTIGDRTEISSFRSLEEAKQIAIRAIDMLDEESSRSVVRSLDVSSVQYVTSVSSRGAQNDTLMYVFNYMNDAGFAVVSAVKGTVGLLAVTEEGSYNCKNKAIEENGGFAVFMDIAENYLKSVKSLELDQMTLNPGFGGLAEFIRREDTLAITKVEPMINVRWEQNGYEGRYAPNGKAGCANVAMAQIMTYFCYPNQINIDYPSATINRLNLDWTEIKKHNIKHAVENCVANDAAHDAIGHLHRQLGRLNYSNYEKNSTGTSPLIVPNTFSRLGYSVSDYKNYNLNSLYEDLSMNTPVFMSGYDLDEVADTIIAGHAWISDGYAVHLIQESEWTKMATDNLWTFVRSYEPYERIYFHMNWGGSGNCNGYFLANVFALAHSDDYDNQTDGFVNTSGWNFNYNVTYFTVAH